MALLSVSLPPDGGTERGPGRYHSTECVEETMKIMRFAIAVGLLAGLGACSDMMGNRGSSQSTAVAAPPAVAPDMVRQVQSKLRDGGYYKGAVDGVWGAETQASLRAFQRDHNLTANGQLDVPTLQALNVASGSASNAANAGPAPGPAQAPTQPNYNPPPQNNPNAPQPGPAPQR
jgi:peptidoglycan hydrolase-like protein with peptidoglycan-binding domain